MNVFVTGTKIGVGKTFIVSALASIMQSLCYSSAAYKPIQTGAYEQNGFMVAPDSAFARKIDPYVTTECTYYLKENLPPVIASEQENIKINPRVILKDYTILANKYDCILVDGTGGLMTPVSTRFTMANLVKMLNIPIVIVSNVDENTVNDVLVNVNHAQTMGLRVNGVILNKCPDENDFPELKVIPRLIEEYSDAKVIGMVEQVSGHTYSITPSIIIDTVLNGVDVEKIFDIKIPKLDV